MSEWNSRITIAVVLLAGVFAIGQLRHHNDGDKSEAIAASNSAVKSSDAPESQRSNSAGSPRLLKFNLSLSSPNDLKVRQGDTVGVGAVLADRVEERSRLTLQRRSLEISIQQIQTRVLLKPPIPLVPPTVRPLPPISYAEETAAISTAQMNITGAERALQQQSQVTGTMPQEESSAADLTRTAMANKQRLLENQKRKLEAVGLLKDLPSEVAAHEQEVLKQREADLQQATAEYQQADSKLTAAVNARNEKLTQLTTALQQARADYNIALAKLQTKKDTRAYAEYEASVTAARRTEEKNQAESNYYRQLQDFQQQERDRSFQLAQLNSKLAEVDDRFSTISVVTSPYSGNVRRIKFVRQNDNNLSVELTLVVGDRSSSSLPDSTTTSPSPQSSSSPSR